MGEKVLVRIGANVPWQITEGGGGNYVGVCEPLKLTVQGATWAELMEDIAETIDAMFKDLLSTNELDRFLHDQGWTSSTIPTEAESVRFDVPFIPAMVGAHGSPRNVYQ